MSTSFSQLAPCFYHEWIYLHFLARVDEDAVLSDSALSGSMAADAVVSGCSSSALGPLRFRGSCAVVFGDPTGSFSGDGPTSSSSWSAARAVVSPVGLWSDLHMSVVLSSRPFSRFRVEPEPVSISAASVKVAGVTRPVRNHTFSPLLALISLFPRSQRS